MNQFQSADMLGRFAQVFCCEADVAAAIAGFARHASYPPRAIIIGLGSRCEHVHIVLAGRARARAMSADGRQAVLEDYLAGDLIGEMALVDAGDSALEVIAVELVEAAALLAHAMVALMTSHASVALAISRRVIVRLAEQNRRLAESSTLSATGRVHAEILRLARQRADLTIRPAPVLSQLAMQVQTTRETVSRTISMLEKRGIIRRDEVGLAVIAEHRLEDLVY
jgi:CRP/FNR family cyclic AMP-dependent transcriptional regulator